MAKRFGIQFKGFDEMLEKYQRLNGQLKPIIEECLEIVPTLVNPKLEADIARHRRTGRTAKSLAKSENVHWQGTVAAIDVGFHISQGGLASIFLMYGTARHAPANQYGKGSGINNGMTADKKLYDDIYGAYTHRKINEKQKEIFTQAIEKRMGG